MKRLHLLCNSHLDPAWQWEWNEGISAALSTFQSAANLAEEFDYIFCHNEAVLYMAAEKYAPELFKQIDSRKKRIHPDTDGIIASLEKGDLRGITMRMYNVFEEVLPRRFGEIVEIKGAFTDLGAIGAMMTGTGSAVFGVFDNAEKAAAAHAQLVNRYRECYLTRPINRYY